MRRDWGQWTVALLWNPGATEQSVTLDFAEAGLDPARRYAVWSFWENRFLGVAKESWTTPMLAPAAIVSTLRMPQTLKRTISNSRSFFVFLCTPIFCFSFITHTFDL